MLFTTLVVLSFVGPGDPVVQRPGASPQAPSTPGAPAVQRPGQKSVPVEEPEPELQPEPEPEPEPEPKAGPIAAKPEPAPAAPAPEPEPAPSPAPAKPAAEVVATAAPVVQRPAKRPTWNAWAKHAEPAPAPQAPVEWSPFVGPDGPHVLPMSLITRFAEPAVPEWDGTYTPQVWEDEKAPVVKDPNLGRKKRERRNRRWDR